MEPLIALTLDRNPPAYGGGDPLWYEYQIDAVPAEEVLAVESSVLWSTEGKGEEDMGVVFFRRRTPGEAESRDLRPAHRHAIEVATQSPQLRWRDRENSLVRARAAVPVERARILARKRIPTGARAVGIAVDKRNSNGSRPPTAAGSGGRP